MRHGRALGIGGADWSRYLKKAIFCSWCYVDITSARGLSQLAAVGEAGFLSAAFDVCTDWSQSRQLGVAHFDHLVAAYVTDPETRQLASELYRVKCAGGFRDDGLERGIPALRLVLRAIGRASDKQQQWGSLEEVGRALQLVDDVLDVEQDRRRNELNCLLTPEGAHHARRLLALWDDGQFQIWFGNDATVLNYVIGAAVKKCLRVLSVPGELLQPAPGICDGSQT